MSLLWPRHPRRPKRPDRYYAIRLVTPLPSTTPPRSGFVQHAITCTYCNTHCRIPNRTLLAMRRGGGSAEPFWALFRLPSAKRAELENRNRPAARDTEHDESPEALEQPPIERSQGAELLAWTLQIGVPLAMLALIGMILFAGPLLAWIEGRTSYELPLSAAPTYQMP